MRPAPRGYSSALLCNPISFSLPEKEMGSPAKGKEARKRITFNRKASAQMLEQAARLLAEAKALHDQLEGYYTGAMDFAAVDAVGERTLQKYEHIFQSYGL